MTDPIIYAHTYWSHKGKYPEFLEELNKLVPVSGEIENADLNPMLEKFRIASNCYYDLYNNGLCNRGVEFRQIFGFEGPEYGSPLTKEVVDGVEDAVNQIILDAAKEQRIPRVISHDDWIERGRQAVLDALDEYVRSTTQFNDSRGWIDQELPSLFHAVDVHLDSIAERINLGIEPGSLSVRIAKAKD